MPSKLVRHQNLRINRYLHKRFRWMFVPSMRITSNSRNTCNRSSMYSSSSSDERVLQDQDEPTVARAAASTPSLPIIDRVHLLDAAIHATFPRHRNGDGDRMAQGHCATPVAYVSHPVCAIRSFTDYHRLRKAHKEETGGRSTGFRWLWACAIYCWIWKWKRLTSRTWTRSQFSQRRTSDTSPICWHLIMTTIFIRKRSLAIILLSGVSQIYIHDGRHPCWHVMHVLVRYLAAVSAQLGLFVSGGLFVTLSKSSTRLKRGARYEIGLFSALLAIDVYFIDSIQPTC